MAVVFVSNNELTVILGLFPKKETSMVTKLQYTPSKSAGSDGPHRASRLYCAKSDQQERSRGESDASDQVGPGSPGSMCRSVGVCRPGAKQGGHAGGRRLHG